jgi:hypothetical protein
MNDLTEEPQWAHWKRIDEWTVAQATCLLLRVNPHCSFGEVVGKREALRGPFTSTQSRLCREGAQLLDLIWASHRQRKLDPDRKPVADSPQPMPPHEWIRWAKSKALEIPAELTDIQVVAPVRRDRTDDRERLACLNTIGALLVLLLEERPSAGGKARALYASQARIIDTVLEAHPEKYGMSKRNLEAIFAGANKAIARKN